MDFYARVCATMEVRVVNDRDHGNKLLYIAADEYMVQIKSNIKIVSNSGRVLWQKHCFYLVTPHNYILSNNIVSV